MTVTTQGGQAKELLVLDLLLNWVVKLCYQSMYRANFQRYLYEGGSLNSGNLVLREDESGSNLSDACDFSLLCLLIDWFGTVFVKNTVLIDFLIIL